MAITDKNIWITPNSGSSTSDPVIAFTGGSSTSSGTVNLRTYPLNSGTLSFEGTAGQLFSITNTLSGSIFSVNDISGIPSIEVMDTGLIKILPFSGSLAIGTQSASAGIDLHSWAVDGASATGTIIDTNVNLTGTSAKLLIVSNSGAEKFSIDKAGNLAVINSAGITAGSITLGTTSGVYSPAYKSYDPYPINLLSAKADSASSSGTVINTSAAYALGKLLVIANNSTEKLSVNSSGSLTIYPAITTNPAATLEASETIAGFSGLWLATSSSEVRSSANYTLLADMTHAYLNAKSTTVGNVYFRFGNNTKMTLSASGELNVVGGVTAANFYGGTAYINGVQTNTGVVSIRGNGGANGITTFSWYDGASWLAKSTIDKDGYYNIGSTQVAGTWIMTREVASPSPYGLSLSSYASASAGAVAFTFNTLSASLTGATAKLVSFKNYGTEEAYVDKSGTFGASAYTFNDVYALSSAEIGGANTTGISAPAVSTLGLYTSATEQMRISSTGKVGIGTTNPLALLSIGSGSISDVLVPLQLSTYATAGNEVWMGINKAGGYGLLIGYTTASQFGTSAVIRQTTTDPLMFTNWSGAVNNNTMTLVSSGRVGIGVTAPSATLHVRSNSNNFQFNDGASSVTPNISISANGGKAAALMVGSVGSVFAYDSAGFFGIYSDTNANIVAGTSGGGTERVRVDATGAMGVGTSAPGTRLEVSRLESTTRTAFNDILTITAMSNVNPYSGHGGGLLFAGSNYTHNNGKINYARIGAYINDNSVSSAGANMFFDVTPSSTGSPVLTTAMTIQYDGKVGIGTTTPTSLLTVNGPILVGSSTGTLTVTSTVSGAAATFTNISTTGDVTGSHILLNTADSNMAIKAAGPGGGSGFYNYLAGVYNDTGLKTSIWQNGSTRSTDGGGNTFNIRNDAGDLRLMAANTSSVRIGTGGAASAQTDRMVVTSNGFIGMGTATPSSTLHITGTTRIESSIIAPGVNSVGSYFSPPYNSYTWNTSAGSYVNNNVVAPDGNTTAATLTLHSGTGANWDLYRTFSGLTVGATYRVSAWIKLGTATNFCMVVNNTSAWNTIGGRSFTAADGLSSTAWSHVSYKFAAPATTNINWHVGAHAETAVAPQTDGTVFMWNPEVSIDTTASFNAVKFAEARFMSGVIDTSGNLVLKHTASRADITIGNTISSNSGLPTCIDMGGTYSSVPGTNLKVKLFADNTSPIASSGGLGVSSNQVEYVVSWDGDHVFYTTGSIRARINSSGLRSYVPISSSQGITSAGTISGTGGTFGNLTMAGGNNVVHAGIFVTSNSSSPVLVDAAVNTIGYVNNYGMFGQSDGALYAQAYNANWVGEIYQDYRTGQLGIRGKYNGTWQSWRSVVDSVNVGTYALAATNGNVTGSVIITGTLSGTTSTFTGVSVNGNAVYHAANVPTGSSTVFGVVRAGAGLGFDATGSLTSSGGSYTLPTASAATLGGVKVDGTTVSISAGVLGLTAGNVTTALGSTYVTNATNSTNALRSTYVVSGGVDYGSSITPALSTVVIRDGSSAVSASYFNSTDDVDASTISYMMGKTSGNTIRSFSSGSVKTFIGLSDYALNSNSTLYNMTMANSAVGNVPLTVNAVTNTTANLQDWKVNSVPKVTINASGSVGIGTATPAYKLDVIGTSGTVGVRVSSSTSNDTLFYGTGLATGTINVLGTALGVEGDVAAWVKNANTGSTSNAFFQAISAGATGGDPFFCMTVPAAYDFSMGLDNSDADKFKMGYNANPSTGTPAVTIDTAGNLGLGISAPLAGLHVVSRTTATATATGTVLDTFNDLTGTSAKLLSIQRSGTEKAYFDKDGYLTIGSTTIYGTSLVANTIYSAGGTYQSNVAGALTLRSSAPDAVSATGTVITTTNNITGSNAKLLSIQNSSSEKAYIDKDGGGRFGALYFGAIGNTKYGAITNDGNNFALAGVVGNQYMNIGGSTSVFNTITFNANGNSSFPTQFYFQTAGVSKLTIDQSGNLNYGGTLTPLASGTNTIVGSMADGASAIAVALNSPAYTISGAKLLSIRNNGTEKAHIDYSGSIVSTGGYGVAAIDTSVLGAAYGGMWFGATVGSPAARNATNYSLLGNGTDTFINAPTGGTIYFRNGNTTYGSWTTTALNTAAISGTTGNFTGLNVNGNAVIHAGNIGSQSVNYAAAAGWATRVISNDTRNTYSSASDFGAGISMDFKANTVSGGLSDGGAYHGQVTFRQYGAGTDWSGGGAHQLGFSQNGNIWHRYATGSIWPDTWIKMLDTTGGTITSDTGLTIARASNPDQQITITGGDGGGVATLAANYQLNLRSTNTSYPMTFQISTNEKMRIHTNGYVGIGTTTPDGLLTVNGATNISGAITLANNLGINQKTSGGSSAQILNLDTANNLNIGSAAMNSVIVRAPNVNFRMWDATNGFKVLLAEDNVSSYALPIGGGTLTGPLSGTGAYFSGITQLGSPYAAAYRVGIPGTIYGTLDYTGFVGTLDASVQFVGGTNSNQATVPAVKLGSTVSLTSGTAKLVSFQNSGSEKAYIDKDGGLTAGSSIYVNSGLVFSNGGFSNNTTASTAVYGRMADGASAVSVVLDTYSGTTYSTSGSKLLSVRNNGTEKAYVDKDGGISGSCGYFTSITSSTCYTNTISSSGSSNIQICPQMPSGLGAGNSVFISGSRGTTTVTAGNAGGNVTIASGDGGPPTSGISGSGGTIFIKGGSGGIGGAVSVSGGNGDGGVGYAGGAVTIVGGGGSTGGTINIVAGSGTALGGAVNIRGGDGSSNIAGGVTIDAGAAATVGTITIGGTNAGTVVIGKTAGQVRLSGTVTGSTASFNAFTAPATTFTSLPVSNVQSLTRTTADQTLTNSTTAAQALTNMNFYAQASAVYEFEFNAIMSSIGNTVSTWSLTGPASPTYIAVSLIGQSTTAGAAQHFSSQGTSYPSIAMTAGAAGIWRMCGIFSNGATAGTVQLNFALSTTGLTVTIKANSFVTVRRIA